ncbi:MAG TPA: MbcA/ParS/Xre antitoxin family protein [Flavobacteriales bacterium]|nr:MbcA/ParS/Xre antitoxin family protein [Flavobacteriales bacterium]
MAKQARQRKEYNTSERDTRVEDPAEEFLVRLSVGPRSVPSDRLAITHFSALLKAWPLTSGDWAYLLRLQPRTIAERIRHSRDFTGLEAERVRVVERVLERGKEVFGTADKLGRWLDRSHPLFEGKKPKEMLVTMQGLGLVMAELGRIEHGVF